MKFLPLEETLVLFVTEFGRTVYSQGAFDEPGAARDHHESCFSVWMAGSGVRGGSVHGVTDGFCYSKFTGIEPARVVGAVLV